ncbi:(Fe-S)-binding protein [Chloroflexus sp.]|uniref:(Fe-S)-binding protein n=1 Tax=Chloroflexus sp. TaxID=1904827 RepID=UPI00298F3C51|nr:(Fe-S)-binding protein [Chloroflexus sp.]MCS6888729.1 (Fe-S)-binding protein [Chloroflexus sp.]MCX7859183.1 (Fe-S)-binding protein [Chloroflexus sp.]MDW8405104.1 (Fe-S)-binding protein [Chloroflexus sp.]
MEAEMQLFVDSLRKNITAEDVVNFEACMDCKMCGEACAWYLVTGDEKLHPTHKTGFIRQIYQRYLTIEGRIGGALGLVPTPTVADLKENMQYFWACTACGRCTLACPSGISIRRMVRLARAAYSDSGLSNANPTIRSIVENTDRHRHSFGLTAAQVLGRVGLFLRSEGLEVPVNVHGAEMLFVCPAAGNTKIPDYGIKLIKILNAAGVSYTISPYVIDTGTEIDHIAVHHNLSKQMLLDWEQEADRLGVKSILLVECGCDTRTLYAEATETLGRPFRYPIVSVDALMLDLIRQGRLPIEKTDLKVTLHDPCYATRLSGLGDLFRELLNLVTDNFIEMTPNREHNYCCNGGAGGMRLPENTNLRRKISVLKANQIRATGADYVTSPCVVCTLSLEDTCQTYNLSATGDRMALVLFEVVYAAMEPALAKRGELDRMRVPAELRNRDREFFIAHSIEGQMATLMQQPDFPALLDWLEKDDIVKRFSKDHPQVYEQLRALREMALDPECCP